MGSILSFRILYRDADGIGGEVKWDGENAETATGPHSQRILPTPKVFVLDRRVGLEVVGAR